MELVADVLLAAGAFGAALYCLVLARRLARFTTLENGMGGAIAVLSAQVDDMTRALAQAQAAAGDSTRRLETLTRRAEAAGGKLELLVAAMHDLPAPPVSGAPAARPSAPPESPESATKRPRKRLVLERRRAGGAAAEATEETGE
jgi:hypothetical protein